MITYCKLQYHSETMEAENLLYNKDDDVIPYVDLANKTPTILAKDDYGVVIGYARTTKAEYYASVASVFVVPSYRRKGIGAELLRLAIQACGNTRVIVYCLNDKSVSMCIKNKLVPEEGLMGGTFLFTNNQQYNKTR